MVKRDMPEALYIQCPNCDDMTEHDILKGRMGNDNVTGTFKCTECGRTFSDTIRIPRILNVKVLFSDGDQTETTETQLESNEVISIGDEFYMDNGKRVCVTFMDTVTGERVKRAQADKIVRLWVKQFDVLSVKVSVNDDRVTYSLRVEAEPDDEFTIGMTLAFDDYDTLIHAIKTKDRLMKKGTAEAREITRIYGKMRRKIYGVLETDDEELGEFNESDYIIDEDDD